MISIVCYFLLFPVVFAFNVSIYSSSDYFNIKSPEPVLIVENKYEFVYHLDEKLMMQIVLKNKTPNDIASFYITSSLTHHYKDEMTMKNTIKCREGDCLSFKTTLNSSFINIGMQIKRGTVPYATLIISEGIANSTSKLTSLCVKPRTCVMVIDLQKESSKDFSPQEQPQSTWTPQNNVYIYVIPSVLVICVIVLAIYISVKKLRNRKSKPEDTLQLNTYATKNEVLYADLSFVQGNIQPPRQDEESPYAEIMGVMRPQ